MLKNLFTHLLPKKKISGRILFTVFALLALVMRFPFFFRDYIDKDESTFILMGQAWVDGNLPYTMLWDLKPPLVFAFFAAIIYFFGKSFFAIRLAGVLVVAITSFFVERIGSKVHSCRVGLWSGILYVIFSSAFGSLQGVMSEHLSMIFFVPAIWVLIRNDNTLRFLWSGLLFGAALMMKINLAYAVLLVGTYALYLAYKDKRGKGLIISSLYFSLGIAIPIGSTYLPYHLNNISEIWWNSVIAASLQYNAAKDGNFLKTLMIVVPMLLLSAFFVLKSERWKVMATQRKYLFMLLLALAGILFSFVKIGKLNGHYLIQAHAILVIFVCIACTRMPKFNYRPLLIIFLLGVQAEAVKEYMLIGKRAVAGKSLYNGEGIEIPVHLTEKYGDVESVYFINYHIGYWLLDTEPITMAVTHPSNIVRDDLYPFMNNPRKNAMEEIDHIMKKLRPTFVITKYRYHFFLDKEDPEDVYFKYFLDNDYELTDTIGQGYVFKRKPIDD
ncbi:ArnT family glycosyltransferase [Sungkyunkwania multivorans]|uniref:ArnT family glycosyltransferase n=1 Tax=Sungkyunkwania multivorans TaxID=1173618 RepID=A0ABW3CZV6_9FLAO